MQQLTSPADHDSIFENGESEEETVRFPSEYTPLIPRRRRSRARLWTPIFVVFIFFILIFGVMIGTYLLIEEDKEWPVSIPFEIVSRNNWDIEFQKNYTNLPTISLPATHIVLSHTNSTACENFDECKKILLHLKEMYMNPPFSLPDIPFNFMIGMDGETYEGRGWDILGDSALVKDNKSISLGLIGNFKTSNPSDIQLNEVKGFINEAIRRKKLISTYIIVGGSFGDIPTKLFKSLASWRQWSSMYL